jgi:single-strand DNA-binding protein
MASFNKVILLGNLTRDPELRSTPSGTPVASFGLAMNTPRAGQRSHERGEQDPAPERRDDVCFVDIVAFGRQAETASEYLRKGRAALIEGRLQWRSWAGQDGQQRQKHEVLAERIHFMPRGREDGMEHPRPGPGMAYPHPGPSRAEEESDMPPVEEDDIPF